LAVTTAEEDYGRLSIVTKGTRERDEEARDGTPG